MPTGACFSMIPGCAVSSESTNARIAKGSTFFSSKVTSGNVITDFIGGTFVVALTSYFNTGNQGVTLQTGRTNADGGVKVNFTLSPATTLGSQAWVYTFL